MNGHELYIVTGAVIGAFGWGIVLGVRLMKPAKKKPKKKKEKQKCAIGQKRRVKKPGDERDGHYFKIIGPGEYDGFDGEIRFNDGSTEQVMWSWIYENSEVIDG